MQQINKLIDFSTWTGNWPFINLRYKELDALKQKLQGLNIIKAFVAPIEGILEQDPMRANKKLLADVRDDFFSPVLILDLSYANWEEGVELALMDGRVKIVKIIPNYHMYEVCEENLEKLVRLTEKHNLIISIQMRVEDIRGQYRLMTVSDVEILKVVKTLSYFPNQIFILQNMFYHDEIRQVLDTLGKVYIDIACFEVQGIMHILNSQHGLDRFLFSSHCPFFYPEGNINKLKYSELDAVEIEKVAFKNAEKLLAKTNI